MELRSAWPREESARTKHRPKQDQLLLICVPGSSQAIKPSHVMTRLFKGGFISQQRIRASEGSAIHSAFLICSWFCQGRTCMAPIMANISHQLNPSRQQDTFIFSDSLKSAFENRTSKPFLLHRSSLKDVHHVPKKTITVM